MKDSSPDVQGGRLARNAIRSVGIGLLALVPALVLPAVYARTLAPADLATWLFAASISSWVVSFHLGIGPAASALVARVDADRFQAASILKVAFALGSLAALLAVGALALANHAGLFEGRHPGSPLGPNVRWVVDVALIGSALVMPIHPLSGYFSGRFQVGRLWPVNLVHKGALTVAGLVAAVVWRSAEAAALGHLLAGGCTFVALLLLYRAERAAQSPTPPMTLGQWRVGAVALLGLAMPAALSGLAQLPLSGLHSVVVADRIPQVLVPFAVLTPVLTLAGGLIWAVAGNLLPEMSAAFAGARAAGAGPGAGAERDHQNRVVAGSVAVLGFFLTLATGLGAAILPAFLAFSTSPAAVSGHEGPLAAYAVALMFRQATLPVSLAFFANGRPWLGLLPTYLDALVSAALALVLPQFLGLPGLVLAVVAGFASFVWLALRLLAGGDDVAGVERGGGAGSGNGLTQLRRSLGTALPAGVLLSAVALAGPGHRSPTLQALLTLGAGLLLLAWQWSQLPTPVRQRLTTALRGLAGRVRGGAAGTPD